MDRLEAQLVNKAQVVRLDILSRVGRQAAARYGVRGTPTLVVVDGSGQLVYGRYGIPMPGQVIEQVDTLIAAN